MARVSVIIPSRNCEYVHQTIDDVFSNATGHIEVIVLLDGWKPLEPIKPRPNLEVIERTEPMGLRHGINYMATFATGDFIFKCDDHCAFGKGFDSILADQTDDNWLVTPTRYRLNVKTWSDIDCPIEYLYLTFPYKRDSLYGTGFHGKKWVGKNGIGDNMGRTQYYWMENARKHVKIDDIQVMQGSGWFTSKKHFNAIDRLDEVHSHFYQEANELCFKTWLSGGRVVVNKNTWYAHLHKNEPRNHGLTMGQKRETERFQTWVWMNNKWPKATQPMSWFVNAMFYPIPGWPDNWQSYVKDEVDHRVFDLNGHDGFKINELS